MSLWNHLLRQSVVSIILDCQSHRHLIVHGCLCLYSVKLQVHVQVVDTIQEELGQLVACRAVGCCPVGTQCTRQDSFYWQCKPGSSPSASSPPPASPSSSVPSSPSPASSSAPAVQTDTFLDKTPVYPDSLGGLTGFTPLGPTLPNQTYQSIAPGQMCMTYHYTLALQCKCEVGTPY